MIKTTLKSIITGNEVLGKLAGKPMSVGASYKLAKIIKEINEELTIYDAERIKICEKYGTINNDTNAYDITDKTAFDKEIAELLEQSAELNCDKIVLDDDCKISANDISLIIDFMEV